MNQRHCVWYSSVIFALANSNDPRGAEAAQNILSRLQSSDHLPRPTATIYIGVFVAWKRSLHPEKVERAWELLERCLQDFEEIKRHSPSKDMTRFAVDIHESVLVTCCNGAAKAAAAQRDKVLKIALQVFSRMPERNSRVYYNALKTFSILLKDNPAERDSLMRNVFLEHARQADVLDPRLKNVMLLNFSEEQYARILQDLSKPSLDE
jgi:hypothetical protein